MNFILKFIRRYIYDDIKIRENKICEICKTHAKYCVKPMYCLRRHQYCYGCVSMPECRQCKYFLTRLNNN